MVLTVSLKCIRSGPKYHSLGTIILEHDCATMWHSPCALIHPHCQKLNWPIWWASLSFSRSYVRGCWEVTLRKMEECDQLPLLNYSHFWPLRYGNKSCCFIKVFWAWSDKEPLCYIFRLLHIYRADKRQGNKIRIVDFECEVRATKQLITEWFIMQ